MSKNKSTEDNEEQIKTASNSEVIAVATEMMDQFDESFKELAK